MKCLTGSEIGRDGEPKSSHNAAAQLRGSVQECAAKPSIVTSTLRLYVLCGALLRGGWLPVIPSVGIDELVAAMQQSPPRV